jgi:hypothetical protein
MPDIAKFQNDIYWESRRCFSSIVPLFFVFSFSHVALAACKDFKLPIFLVVH